MLAVLTFEYVRRPHRTCKTFENLNTYINPILFLIAANESEIQSSAGFILSGDRRKKPRVENDEELSWVLSPKKLDFSILSSSSLVDFEAPLNSPDSLVLSPFEVKSLQYLCNRKLQSIFDGDYSYSGTEFNEDEFSPTSKGIKPPTNTPNLSNVQEKLVDAAQKQEFLLKDNLEKELKAKILHVPFKDSYSGTEINEEEFSPSSKGIKPPTNTPNLPNVEEKLEDAAQKQEVLLKENLEKELNAKILRDPFANSNAEEN